MAEIPHLDESGPRCDSTLVVITEFLWLTVYPSRLIIILRNSLIYETEEIVEGLLIKYFERVEIRAGCKCALVSEQI